MLLVVEETIDTLPHLVESGEPQTDAMLVYSRKSG